MQLPMHTWSTLILPISSMVFTLSGLCGIAAIGVSAERSITICSSYSASASARKRRKVRFAALCREEFPRRFVAREDGRGCAEFGAHIGDGRAFRNRKRLDTLRRYIQ